ncbi:tetratricopeptide repeat protein [Endozoicomonas sp. ALC020]|uniref:tetratricopeptide repeat protein n=1 Tax=Endozoicomonas sp. ALC020 TaxID=3403077 RepID=UPI003BAED33A
MSYGPTPTTNAPASSGTTTSQLSQYCASGSDTGAAKGREFTLNPNAETFIPRSQLPHRGHQHWHRPSNIQDRPVTSCQRPTPRTFHPEAKTYSPVALRKEINSAFAMLNNQNFIDAEKKFRVILNSIHGIPDPFEKRNVTVGLARSLKEQTCEKQLEACSILEELRLDGTLNRFGASTIYNLDLTLSLCEEALGRHFDAETRLLRLRKKRLDADERTLCEPSRYYAADINNARLWQSMGKYTLAETLFLNIKKELIKKLQSNPYSPDTSKLRKYLDTVNIALVRLWQFMDKHQEAELLMLGIIGKRPDDHEDVLCRQSDRKDVDLALTFIWRALGQHERAERLLLNISRKHPDDSEEILCRPTGDPAIDIALVRIWEELDKFELAEKLLLNISGKRPDDNEELLCEPFGHHDIDLGLALRWQRKYKYIRAEKLLLNMSGKRPGDSEEELCKLSGNREIDLALARHWELTGRYKLAEKLLLNICGMHPNASIDSLCSSCGNMENDLARVRLWEMMGKHEWSEKLMLNMIGMPPGAIVEELCKPFGHHDIDLTRARLWQEMKKFELSERLLLNMSGKHFNADEDSLCKPSGNQQIDLTLVRLWDTTGKCEQAERLTRRCCELYHSNEWQLTLLYLSTGKAGFLEMISRCPESVNTLVATSIHYFTLACDQIKKDGPESAKENLEKALEQVESALQKYPPNAGAYSQKAHCLRMLGRSKQQWRECFARAQALDYSRNQKGKADFWRRHEYIALEIVRGLTG